MRHGRYLFATALIFCSYAISSTQAAAVANLGNLEQITFRGHKTYTAEQLRAAIRLSNDVQFAAHPTAPLDEFLAALQSFVEQGYRNGGFADPVIRAFPDRERGHVVVDVHEGDRYRQGDIKITGGDRLPSESMRQCLLGLKAPADKHLVIRVSDADEITQESADKSLRGDDAPKWVPGEYVRFDRRLHDLWRRRLDTLLRDLGRIDTRIDFNVELKQDSGTADLVIAVVDAGRQIAADRILVRGLERNSREQLLEFLGVRQGMPIDAEAVARMENQLYNAARFVTHDVSLVRQDNVGEISLVIAVTEVPGAPLLNEDFNPRQLALLRLGRWLDRWEENAGYIECHVASTALQQAGGEGTLDFVVSPSRGLTGSLLAKLDQRRVGYAVAITRARTAIFNAERQRCYVHPPLSSTQVEVKLGLSYTDGAVKTQFKLDGYAKSDLKQDVPPALRLKIAPALAVHRAASKEIRWVKCDDGLTAVEFEDATITFDEETGRVHSVAGSSQQYFAFRLEFATDRAAVPHEDFASRYIGLTDTYRADCPNASFVGFAVGEFLWIARAEHEDHDRLSRRADILSNLVASRLGPALESLANVRKEKDGETFPGPRVSTIPITTDYRVILGACGPALADKLFPRRSWPWILLREAAFTVQGRSKYALDEVQFLLTSPEVGPLGCAVLAKTMSYVKAAELSHRFASTGLERLTRQDLQRDMALFTAGDKSATKLIAVVVDLFRSLTSEEVSALCELYGKPDLSKQIQGLHNILAFDRRPSNELIASRVETFWDIAIKSGLEKSLRNHLLAGHQRQNSLQR